MRHCVDTVSLQRRIQQNDKEMCANIVFIGEAELFSLFLSEGENSTVKGNEAVTNLSQQLPSNLFCWIVDFAFLLFLSGQMDRFRRNDYNLHYYVLGGEVPHMTYTYGMWANIQDISKHTLWLAPDVLYVRSGLRSFRHHKDSSSTNSPPRCYRATKTVFLRARGLVLGLLGGEMTIQDSTFVTIRFINRCSGHNVIIIDYRYYV